MSPVKIFLITKPLVITSTPPPQLRSVHIVFLPPHDGSLSTHVLQFISLPFLFFYYFQWVKLYRLPWSFYSYWDSSNPIVRITIIKLCHNTSFHKCLGTQSSWKSTRSFRFIIGLFDTCYFVEWYSRRFTVYSLRQRSQKCSIKRPSFWIVYNVTHFTIISIKHISDIYILSQSCRLLW